jgi:hypothetical protein
MTTPDGLDESAHARDGPSTDVTDGSAVLGAVRDVSARVSTAVRSSVLYTWLTKEPEPEVIVIDLRETRTVGPIIALLDRAIGWLTPYWRSSTPKRALDEVAAVGDRAAETRAGQLLVTVLAPPEPPATDDAESGSTPAPSSTDASTRHTSDAAAADTSAVDSDSPVSGATTDSEGTRQS